MKKTFITLALTLSSAAFAISDAKLAKKCEAKGLEKLVASAEAANCDYVPDTLQVVEIDNRLLNPSKYVWYEFDAKCEEEVQFRTMKKLVQYNSLTKECL